MAISSDVKRNMESAAISFGKEYADAQGNNKLIDLSCDYPAFDAPSEFNDILKDVVMNPRPGMHRYMENAGYTYTRTFAAEKISKETGINLSQSDVIMTCGAGGAFNMILKTLLNPGDEVAALLPCPAEYKFYAANHGGVFKAVPFTEGFLPDYAALEKMISPRTRALIINSPNNPSGVVYSEKTLRIIADIVERKSKINGSRIYIISDDVYVKFFYSNLKCPRIFSYYPHTILIYSYSQELCLAGERIGYAAVHPDCEDAKDIMAGLIYANRVLGYINAPALMQNAITRFGSREPDISGYSTRRDFLFKELTGMGFHPEKSEGSYFMLVKSPIQDDKAFIDELKGNGVKAQPGSLFQAPGYFRISYCVETAILQEALKGLKAAIQKFS
jgi:aspartate aminotransferase